MIEFFTIFMVLSSCVGMYLFTYIINNGHTHYMKYLAVLIMCMIIYIFGYMLELHSNSLETALFWNGIQYLTIPIISTLWLIMALLYIGLVKKVRSRVIPALFIIPVITYIARFTNNIYFLYYSGYTFKVYGEIGILELSKGYWYYVQRSYEVIEIVFIGLIFWIYSYRVSADKKNQYICFALLSWASISGMLLAVFDPTGLGIDYTAIILPTTLFILSFVIVKQDFFEISLKARNRCFYQSNDAIIILNDKKRIIDYNLKAIEFFENNGIKLTNADLNMFYDDNSTLIEALYSDQVEIYQDYFRYEHRYWEISSHIVSADVGKNQGIVKIIRNITTEYSAKKHFEQIAMVDELTQLYNRRAFNEQAEQVIKQSDENDTSLIMLMFDVDFFKKINDTFGHQNGDLVLKRIAKEMGICFRNDDLIARIGGEEFVALLPGISESMAFIRAEEYRKRIADLRFIQEDLEYQVTVSIGIAVYEKRMSLETLIFNADKALYEAKNSGRNKVVK